MTSGYPLSANPDGGKVIGSLEGPVPIIRLYGVTRDGRSILAAVHGFTPYFFVSPPPGMDLGDIQLGLLRTVLDQRVSQYFKIVMYINHIVMANQISSYIILLRIIA